MLVKDTSLALSMTSGPISESGFAFGDGPKHITLICLLKEQSVLKDLYLF